MKVYVYPCDLGGCGYYRLTWPAMYLQSQGHDVKLVHPKQHNRVVGITADDDPDRLIDIAVPNDADVMVFQRVSSVKMISGFEIIRKRGIAVVIDIDDDMKAIHPSNPVFNQLNPNTRGHLSDYNWVNADKVYAAATLVTASTDALLRRYARYDHHTKSYNGVVLRNVVPDVYLEMTPRPRDGFIGWGGMVRSHPNDPQVTGAAMGRIQRDGYTFRVVGPAIGVKSAFQLDDEPNTTGALELERWPHALQTLSVGIAPLALTRFNEAKSWLKMLEYAALGVPCVGSPTTEYVRLHRMGVGAIAKDPRSWYQQSRKLLDDESRRDELAASGRAAATQLTVATNAWRWLEAWTRAYELERTKTPV